MKEDFIMDINTNGALEWGIKTSLLLYATGAPGGGIQTDGVSSTNGTFHFPLTNEKPDEFRFSGSVAVFAHYGAPIAAFARMRVHQAENGNWMLEMSPDDGPAVAAFKLEGHEEGDSSISFSSVELTEIGSEMFGGYYASGEEFEPLFIRLPQ